MNKVSHGRMMTNLPLFRQEAVKARSLHHLGTVFINSPIPYTLVLMGSITLLIGIALFLCFGTYTEQIVVKGYLNSSEGIIRIYPRQAGVIVKQYVQPNQLVHQGEPLLLIHTLEHSKKTVLDQMHAHQKRLQQEITYKKEHLRALKPLLKKQFISKANYHAEQEALIALQNEASTATIYDLRERAARSYVIRAPIDGWIASIHYHRGQYTNAAKPLLKLLPKNGVLVAELFIPVQKAGFLKPKQSVLLQYDAYPHARFGSYKATIQSMSRSVLTDDEEENPMRIHAPYYKVIATLDQHTMRIHGHPIQHGMTLSAVIQGETWKIGEWLWLDWFHNEVIS